MGNLNLRTFIVLSLLPTIFVGQICFAEIDNPARRISAVQANARKEDVIRCVKARVLIADYSLIRRDFPSTRNMSEQEIDWWLVERTGYVSQQQAEQSVVNTQIETREEYVSAWRPKDYNRALVFQADDGLIDAKGVGSRQPKQGDHSNGLASLGEMIREFTYQKLVQMVFDHSGSGYKTVGSYAVIDLGFNIKNPDGTQTPAAAILRQAHKRAPGDCSSFGDKRALAVEKVLRRYGITSAGAYMRSEPIDWINIQGTSDGAIIDFGGFLVMQDFTRRARNFDGKRTLLTPNLPEEFVRPESDIRIPFDLWGYSQSGIMDPQYDNIARWSHDTAVAVASGRSGREAVLQHFQNMINPVRDLLLKHPRSCQFVVKSL